MNTALLLVAQKYTNIVLGTGLKQFHHFYWIEGIEGDPLTKRREIIPYFGLVSRTAIDRGFGEVNSVSLQTDSIDSSLVIDNARSLCGLQSI